jgi:hypothetical protein
LTQPLVISIDAMGGDHGPPVVIPAVARAIAALPGSVRFLLHGDETILNAELAKHPQLLRQAQFLNSHPALRDYVKQHPELVRPAAPKAAAPKVPAPKAANPPAAKLLRPLEDKAKAQP